MTDEENLHEADLKFVRDERDEARSQAGEAIAAKNRLAQALNRAEQRELEALALLDEAIAERDRLREKLTLSAVEWAKFVDDKIKERDEARASAEEPKRCYACGALYP